MARFVVNPNLIPELKRTQTPILEESANQAVAAAKSVAPVRSGDYQRGIKTVVQGDKVFVSATDWKSHWIEFGSIHNSPSAPLRRGVRAVGLTLRESS